MSTRPHLVRERDAQVAPISPVHPTAGRRAPVWVLTVYLLCALAYLALFLVAIRDADRELLQALTIAPILVGLTIPIALRMARTERDATLFSIVMAGLVLKLVTAVVRFYIAFDVYGGFTDALGYHLAGKSLAPDYRHLIFTTDAGGAAGTKFVNILTGVTYAIFGTSRIVGFLVFAWVGFLGLLLLARAFRIGVPNGDGRRYLILCLFLPSLLYWPSAIGKEAWMLLAIGLAAYGMAGISQGRARGTLALLGGIAAMLPVRPHVALVVCVALVFALLVRRVPAHSYAAPMFRVLGLALLLVLGLFLMARTESFLGPKLTAEGIVAQIEATSERTSEAGSAFTPVTVKTPLDMPLATVTVLFRPFPFEASNLQALLTAAESVVLLALVVGARQRLRSIPRLVRTNLYVAFSTGFLLAFVFAFSGFANFGVLARQRVQVLPFLLVFLAIPRFQDLVSATTGEVRASSDGAGTPHRTAGPPGGVRRRSRRPYVDPQPRVAVSSAPPGSPVTAPPRRGR